VKNLYLIFNNLGQNGYGIATAPSGAISSFPFYANDHPSPLNPSEVATGDSGYSQPVQRGAFSDVEVGP
jgi:hypothetical protein